MLLRNLDAIVFIDILNNNDNDKMTNKFLCKVTTHFTYAFLKYSDIFCIPSHAKYGNNDKC